MKRYLSEKEKLELKHKIQALEGILRCEPLVDDEIAAKKNMLSEAEKILETGGVSAIDPTRDYYAANTASDGPHVRLIMGKLELEDQIEELERCKTAISAIYDTFSDEERNLARRRFYSGDTFDQIESNTPYPRETARQMIRRAFKKIDIMRVILSQKNAKGE